MKKYCSGIPDIIKGVFIGDCCKIHDTTCSTSKFYKCVNSRLGKSLGILIASGGAVGCWFKYSKRMVKRVFAIKQEDFTDVE